MKASPEQFALPGLAAMGELGSRIGTALAPGDLVALRGPLGVGKTTLARAILRGAGYQGEVPSPTFTIIEHYEPPTVRLPIAHADFYRLATPEDVEELGLAEYRENGALLAEWPDNAGGFFGEHGLLSVTLQVQGEGRLAQLVKGPGWKERAW